MTTEPLQAPRNGWSEEAYQRFWARMSEIFGRPWTDVHGSEPTPTWRESLSEMTLQKAAAVLEHYRLSGDRFPPNLSEVMAQSRALRIRDQVQYVSLPYPAVDAAKVSEAIGKMRMGSGNAKRHSILNPGESYLDYQRAFLASGMKQADFDKKRIADNARENEEEARQEREAIQLESEVNHG